MKNLGTSLSKSLTERDSTYEICSSLLSLLGIFKKVGSQAQMPPGAQRDAILLPWTLRVPCRSLTYDTARNKRYAMALWNKTLEGTPSLLQWSPTCASCNSAAFSSETLAYNLYFEINSATMDLTHQSSAYLLGARACSKSDRACVLDLSSKSLWSSLVSCEEMSQERKHSMAPWSKSKHDQIPHWCKHTRPTLHLEQSA